MKPGPVAFAATLVAIMFTGSPARAQPCQAFEAAAKDYRAQIIKIEQQVRVFAAAADRWQEQANRLVVAIDLFQSQDDWADEDYAKYSELVSEALEARRETRDAAHKGQLALLFAAIYKGALEGSQRDLRDCQQRQQQTPPAPGACGYKVTKAPTNAAAPVIEIALSVKADTPCEVDLKAGNEPIRQMPEISKPSRGTAVIRAGKLIFTPDPGYRGEDYFEIVGVIIAAKAIFKFTVQVM